MNSNDIVKNLQDSAKSDYNKAIKDIVDRIDIAKFISVDLSRETVKFDSSSFTSQLKREIDSKIKDFKIKVNAQLYK